MNLSIGTLLRNGKYLLKQVLAQDGLLTSYLAIHTESNQPVVVKFLAESLHSQPEFTELQKAFAFEVRRFAPCQHSHLVKIRDLFVDRGLCFVVLEQVVGQSLDEVVRANGKLSEARAVHYIRQVGSALMAMHQRGLLHQDVKPEHIIRRQGTDLVVLTEGSLVHALTHGISQTYAGVVSVGYAAPEQTMPLVSAKPSLDVYGLAASLYYLLTGQTPIAAALRDRIPLVNLRHFQPQLSPGVEQAVLQGMEMDCQKRLPTVEAWLTALLAAQPMLKSSVPLSQPVASPDHPPAMPIQNPAISPIETDDRMPIVHPSPPQVSKTMPAPTTSVPAAMPIVSDAMPASIVVEAAAPASEPLPQLPSQPPQTPTVVKPKLEISLLKWLALTAIVATLIGAGIGISLRLGLFQKSDSPALKPAQDFPPRPWPGP